MGRHKKKIEKGEAISMEDALSMLVVVFVLFVVFLVPLVSMDKNAQLDSEQKDPFWSTAINSLNPMDTLLQYTPYDEHFNLYNKSRIRKSQKDDHVTIECLTKDSSFIVIEHSIDDNTFSAIVIQNSGSSVIYKWGSLQWNPIEKEWRPTQDSTGYYKNSITEKLDYEYRKWIRNLAS